MYFSWLWGLARTTYTHSEETVKLKTKSKEGKEQEVFFSDFCKSNIPPCKINPLLFNGHLQTLWTMIESPEIPIYYKRKVFQSTYDVYPGQFAVDFVFPASQPPKEDDPELMPRTHHFTDEEFAQMGSDDHKPMLVMLHGLAGGSHEYYLRHVLKPLCLDGTDWEACVINSRGCANSQITTPILYNARATWDVRQTVEWLREKYPNRKLFGMGFSLGANMITNYVAEEGENCKFTAAIVASNPWNLEVSSLALQRGFLGLNVYLTAMCSSMKRLALKHIEQMSKNPAIDFDKVRAARYLFEWDRYVQCPTWGWPTEGAYYRDASSVESCLAIRIPFLAVHAEDDPIAVDEAVPREEMKKNPYIVLCSTSLGGHLSWFEVGGERWFARAVTQWLKAFVDEVDDSALKNIPRFDRQRRGSIRSVDGKSPVYDPLRHKLHVPAAIPQ